MLDMLKDRNFLIGAALGAGAGYLTGGSSKKSFGRIVAFGAIGAVAGRMLLPQPAAAAPVLAPSRRRGGGGGGGPLASESAQLNGIFDEEKLDRRRRVELGSIQAFEEPEADGFHYVGRAHF